MERRSFITKGLAIGLVAPSFESAQKTNNKEVIDVNELIEIP